MTDFNTDYNNTELLDQELSFDELQEINGGNPFIIIPMAHAIVGVIAAITHAEKEL